MQNGARNREKGDPAALFTQYAYHGTLFRRALRPEKGPVVATLAGNRGASAAEKLMHRGQYAYHGTLLGRRDKKKAYGAALPKKGSRVSGVGPRLQHRSVALTGKGYRVAAIAETEPFAPMQLPRALFSQYAHHGAFFGGQNPGIQKMHPGKTNVHDTGLISSPPKWSRGMHVVQQTRLPRALFKKMF